MTVNKNLKQATCWFEALLIVALTSKSPLAKKLTTVVLKSGISPVIEPSTVWAGTSNGQLQSIPQSPNSGGQFDALISAISCKTSLQTSP